MSFTLPYFSSSSLPTDRDLKKEFNAFYHQTGDDHVSPIKPIQWTVEKALLLKDILNQAKPGFLVPQTRLVWPHIDEDFRASLERLLISLRAYYDSKNPEIPIDTLIGYLIEKDAASILKKIRIKSYMRRIRSSFIEEPDWWSKIPTYFMDDIGDIFYYKYAFFWEEECDDYKYQDEPVVVNDEYVNMFRRHLKLVINNELDDDFDFEEEEVLYAPRSSKVINSKFESVNDYELRYQKVVGFREGKRLPGKRCIIPVHPGGVRDTIINSLEDLNSILAIDKYVSKLMRKHPQTVPHNMEIFHREYEKMHDDYDYFYCRDITKEGITKPRYILKIMLKELSIKYPRIRKFISPIFFDGDWCHFDDKTIQSQRGHGLGMANSLTTLFQIIVSNMNYELSQSFENEKFKFKFMALNDDCIYCLNCSAEDAFEFSQQDHEILEELGVIRNKTKTFIGYKAGVFLEEYLPSYLNKKESFQRRTMLLPYIATNIVHAKDLFSLMNENKYFDKIIAKWGYEFFPDEIYYPRIFGGWFSKNFFGVDISLMNLDFEEFKGHFSRAAIAVLESDLYFKRKVILSHDPFNILSRDIDSYIKSKIPYPGSPIFGKLERLKQRKNFCDIYRKLRLKRQEIYLNQKSLDFYTTIDLILQKSDRDILIPQNIDSWIHDFDITRVPNGFFDPYRYSFPLCSAKRVFCETKVKYLPTSLWPITQYDATNSNSEIRKDIAEMNLDYYAFEYTNEDVALPNNEQDFIKFCSSWKNPTAVAMYGSSMFNKLPLPKKKLEGLKYRSGFFPRELSKDEYLLLSGKSYRYIIDYMESGQNLEDFDLTQQKEPDKLTEDESSDSESDDYPPSGDHGFDVPEENKYSDIDAVIEEYRIRRKMPTDQEIVEALLPEGWNLESFSNEENILYALKNVELFNPICIKYIDNRMEINHFHILSQYQLGMHGFFEHQDDLERERERWLSQSDLVRQAVEEMRQIAKENADEGEPEFAGDFEIDWDA